VRFAITLHSAVAPPPDAVEWLWQRLGSRRGEVAFSKAGATIRASTEEDAPVSMTRDERSEIGRRVILDVVRDVCDETPGLQSDWFAVSSEL
jgi:hypothetical protein